MSSETMAILLLIGMSGYMIFKYWVRVLKIVIGIIIFCVVYTFISLKKYFDGSNDDKQKIEQVVEETMREGTPTYINE